MHLLIGGAFFNLIQNYAAFKRPLYYEIEIKSGVYIVIETEFQDILAIHNFHISYHDIPKSIH